MVRRKHNAKEVVALDIQNLAKIIATSADRICEDTQKSYHKAIFSFTYS